MKCMEMFLLVDAPDAKATLRLHITPVNMTILVQSFKVHAKVWATTTSG